MVGVLHMHTDIFGYLSRCVHRHKHTHKETHEFQEEPSSEMASKRGHTHRGNRQANRCAGMHAIIARGEQVTPVSARRRKGTEGPP